MKKILLIFLMLLIGGVSAFADTIYDNKGGVIEGKIDGISEGLIQIKNNGNLITIVRTIPSPVYKDNVIARKRLISFKKIKYSGYIIYVDSGFVKMICEDTQLVIPRYKVSKMELYIP